MKEQSPAADRTFPSRIAPSSTEMDDDVTENTSPLADSSSAPAASARLEPYGTFRASGRLPDPRHAGVRNLVPGLLAIVNEEGPIVCERLLQTYVKSAGSSRVSSVMRTALLAALGQAKRDGLVQGRHELGEEGQALAEVVRVAGSDKVRLRSRGDRTFFEIPSSEVGRLMRTLEQRRGQVNREELFRLTLDSLDLTRMTTGVEKTLLAIYQKYCEGAESASVEAGTAPVDSFSSRTTSSPAAARPNLEDVPRNAITADGLARLEHELDQLNHVTLPGLVDHAKAGDAAGMGLEEARKRVAEVSKAIDEAVVVAAPADFTYVQFGSQVRVETPDGEEEFVVVGHAGGQPPQGKAECHVRAREGSLRARRWRDCPGGSACGRLRSEDPEDRRTRTREDILSLPEGSAGPGYLATKAAG